METSFVITNDEYSREPVEGSLEELQEQFDSLNKHYPGEWDIKLVRVNDTLVDDNNGKIVAEKKPSRRQLRYGRLVRGWSYRWLPELRDQAEQARKQAGISRTEFLEQAILLRIAAANTACTQTAGTVPPETNPVISEHPGDENAPS